MMEKHRRLKALRTVKQRKGRDFSSHRITMEFEFELLPLLKHPVFKHVSDFAIMRTVTLLEVFSREWVAKLVDHGAPYIQRAEALTKSVKFDFLLTAALQGKQLTLGEIVAHDVSLNSLEQIIGVFETLLAGDFKERIAAAKDRWKVEIERKDEGPIIGNIDIVCEGIRKLMQVRHIVAHEFPKAKPYELQEVSTLLDAARKFIEATEAVLDIELHGRYPLTQAEMTQGSYEEAERANSKMTELLTTLRSQGELNSELLEKSQTAWVAYRRVEAEFQASRMEGGSAWPMIYALTEADLTTERTKRLESWVERKEEGP